MSPMHPLRRTSRRRRPSILLSKQNNDDDSDGESSSENDKNNKKEAPGGPKKRTNNSKNRRRPRGDKSTVNRSSDGGSNPNNVIKMSTTSKKASKSSQNKIMNRTNSKNKSKKKKNNNNNRNTSSKNRKFKSKQPKKLSPGEKKKQEILRQVQMKIEEKRNQQQPQQQQKLQRTKNNAMQRSGNNNNKKNDKNRNANSNPINRKDNKDKQTSSLSSSSSVSKKTNNNNNRNRKNNNNKKPTFPSLVVNPFQAGQEFRKTIDSLARGITGIDDETKQKYFYLDDRFLEQPPGGGGSSSSDERFTTTTPQLTPSGAFGGGVRGRTLFGSDSILLQGNQGEDDDNYSSMPFSSFDGLEDTFIPEVLVVGATGSVGRLIVRRLLLEGRSKVRVLVRDLYSDTLNMLGTGVTYCQGDLSDIESLEYAVTDVDKIVYVAGAPRPDEKGWMDKMEQVAAEYQSGDEATDYHVHRNDASSEGKDRWQDWADTLETRAQLAEQVDVIGLGNLVRAYQNVRFADFGTSQAAKRSLFKFSGRLEDFHLFSLDEGDVGASNGADKVTNGGQLINEETEDTVSTQYDDYDDVYDDYDDYVDDDDYDRYNGNLESDEYDEEQDMLELEYDSSASGPSTTQLKWLRNDNGNGVFVGRVARASPPRSQGDAVSGAIGGEAAIITSRLRSRGDPENGIDLNSGGFGGFIVRAVGDGGTYEAFIRTRSYEEDGIEYVCQFTTSSKPRSGEDKSGLLYQTIRLGFHDFRPVKRSLSRNLNDEATYDFDGSSVTEPFQGGDVRFIGFRFRASSNVSPNFDRGKINPKDRDYQRFYFAMDYIKLYRNQPEPEFVYLSDSRIPPTVTNEMVDHKLRRIKENRETDGATLLDGRAIEGAMTSERSPEETYYKYKGEKILKSSGLSYTIIRVVGFNELPASEASTIDLLSGRRLEDGQSWSDENDDDDRPDSHDRMASIVPVSRAEVAQVCVSALMDPYALNKSMYMSKKRAVKNIFEEEKISSKFEAVPTDEVVS